MAKHLTHYDPLRDAVRFDPLRSMEDLMREFSVVPTFGGFEPERCIRVDVAETDQAYTVKADMPGFKKDDIRVAVDGDVVTISATMQDRKDETVGNMVYSERYAGTLYRSFNLPQEVDQAKTEAKYKDGVLQLTLPKKPNGAKKQIAIQ